MGPHNAYYRPCSRAHASALVHSLPLRRSLAFAPHTRAPSPFGTGGSLYRHWVCHPFSQTRVPTSFGTCGSLYRLCSWVHASALGHSPPLHVSLPSVSLTRVLLPFGTCGSPYCLCSRVHASALVLSLPLRASLPFASHLAGTLAFRLRLYRLCSRVHASALMPAPRAWIF